jgi:hypothetical protein
MADEAPAAADVVDTPPAAAEGPKTKRSTLDVTDEKLQKARAKLAEVEGKAKVLRLAATKMTTRGTDTGKKAAKEAEAAAAEAKAKALRAEITQHEAKLTSLKQKNEAKETAAAAAAEKNADTGMPQAAVRLLAKLRWVDLIAAFDNKSDGKEKVWDILHEKYTAEVKARKMGDGALVKVGTLKTRMSRELNSFKLYALERVAREESGAPREVIENITIGVTCTTNILWEAGVHKRAKVMPELTIDGGSAAQGGKSNPYSKRKAPKAATMGGTDGGRRGDAESDDEEADEDDFEDEEDDEDEEEEGSSKKKSKLNIGGSSKDKYRPKARKKDKEAGIIEYMKQSRKEDKKEDKKRRKEARKARKKQQEGLERLMKISMGQAVSPLASGAYSSSDSDSD